MYTEIRCPKCFAQVTDQYIDTKSEKARCEACDHSFGIGKKLHTDIRKKYEVPQPPHADVVVIPNHSLDIMLPYQMAQKVDAISSKILMIFLIAKGVPFLFIMPLLFFFTIVASYEFDSNWPFLALLILLVGLGIYIKTRLKGAKEEFAHKVNISIGYFTLINPNLPIPQVVKKEKGMTDKAPIFKMPTQDIQQLYVKEISITAGKYHLYELVIVNTQQEHIMPFIPFINLTDALYLEQEIERYLGLKDIFQDKEIKT